MRCSRRGWRVKARVSRGFQASTRLASTTNLVSLLCASGKRFKVQWRMRVLRHAAAAAAPKEILAVTAVEEAISSLGLSSPDDGLAALLGNATTLRRLALTTRRCIDGNDANSPPACRDLGSRQMAFRVAKSGTTASPRYALFPLDTSTQSQRPSEKRRGNGRWGDQKVDL